MCDHSFCSSHSLDIRTSGYSFEVQRSNRGLREYSEADIGFCQAVEWACHAYDFKRVLWARYCQAGLSALCTQEILLNSDRGGHGVCRAHAHFLREPEDWRSGGRESSHGGSAGAAEGGCARMARNQCQHTQDFQLCPQRVRCFCPWGTNHGCGRCSFLYLFYLVASIHPLHPMFVVHHQ